MKNHYNIISIHWNPLAPWYNYFVAAINSVNIGQFVGQVIGLDLLINGLGQSPDKIHAIGHSLGAHLAGHFARIIKNGASISHYPQYYLCSRFYSSLPSLKLE